MDSETPSVLDGALAVHPQRAGLFRYDRNKQPFLLAVRQRRTLQEGRFLVENRCIAGYFDVTRYYVGQPEHVVGAACAHAQAGFRVPPVLDVALPKLAR